MTSAGQNTDAKELSGKALAKQMREHEKDLVRSGVEKQTAGIPPTDAENAAMSAASQRSKENRESLLQAGLGAAEGAAAAAARALLTPEEKEEREQKMSMPSMGGFGLSKASSPGLSYGRQDLGPAAGRGSLALEMLRKGGYR